MKRHFTGATYELTQENMNGLIEQLEEAKAEVVILAKYCGEVRTWQNRAEDLSEENKELQAKLKVADAEIAWLKEMAALDESIKKALITVIHKLGGKDGDT